MSLRRIVVVSNEAEVQQLARQVSQEVFWADDLVETLDIVKTVNPDLILFDHRFSPAHIREFLFAADENSVNIPVVIVGNGEHDTGSSIELTRMGIYYLTDSQDYDKLKQIVNQINNNIKVVGSKKNSDSFDGTTEFALSKVEGLTAGLSSREAGSLAQARPEQGRGDKFFVDDFAASIFMVGKSRAFVKTLGMIRLVAASRCNPVLIIGETGTGKELAAKAIHKLRHPQQQLVAINCAALTANLLESELFGHVKGSFTGADRDKIGLLELAGSGTIFLDEISEMPLDLQAKLLRVLQEKTFRKVGGVKDITCNATIIASSNRNLYKEMKAHHFRRDLYYRLSICPVYICPLKSPDRREDILLLAEYFLKTSTICPEKKNKLIGLTNLALEVLQKHDWPGNVRELRNVIDRATLLETTDKIGLSSIIIDTNEPAVEGHISESQPAAHDSHIFNSGLPAERVFGQAGSQIVETSPQIKDFSLAKAERELIARALAKTGWQKTQAASLLGITRATLYAKVKQYNIKKEPHALEDWQKVGFCQKNYQLV